MKVEDLIIGTPLGAPELSDDESPFQNTQLLVGAQITRIVIDVLAGTAAALLELRHTLHHRANTGLLRVTGVAQQNWICTHAANEFTAWSITGATVYQRTGEFQLTAQCLPAGALRIVGTSADFLLLEASALGAAPPDYRADPRELIRFGIADENTECEVIGVARSERTPSG